MSRHNRRRTRGGHGQKSVDSSYSVAYPSTQITISTLSTYPRALAFNSLASSGSSSIGGGSNRVPRGARLSERHYHANRNDISAAHWNNRWTKWQARERREREMQAQAAQSTQLNVEATSAKRRNLEAEKLRIFGGERDEADDYDLSSLMMDYFSSLDFIDIPGPFLP
ncbi:hypothetical protein MMC25_002193 [Agyrium rufum]|nr:hypothetical protein [Agyrium rufum]